MAGGRWPRTDSSLVPAGWKRPHGGGERAGTGSELYMELGAAFGGGHCCPGAVEDGSIALSLAVSLWTLQGAGNLLSAPCCDRWAGHAAGIVVAVLGTVTLCRASHAPEGSIGC